MGGFKKIFNIQKKKEEKNGLKNYDGRYNSNRSSTLSLGQSISNWTHKEKEKTKSFDNNNKRYSHPSPPISTSSLSQTTPPLSAATETATARNSVQITQKERHTYNNGNNPFINNSTPPTPSESMRDVNDVVNTLRNSVSSEISIMNSPSFSSSDIEDNHHFHYHNHHTNGHVSNAFPAAIKEEEVEEVEPASTIYTEKRQSQVFYPPRNKFDTDSNKYEVFDEEEKTPDNSVGFTNNINATDTATKKEIGTDKDEQEQTLYSELLQVSLQLNTINPNNANEIKTRLTGVNELLGKALNNSNHLQSKISSIIESSKTTIVTIADENKALKETEEQLKLEIQQLQDSHKAAIAENQDVYEGLVQEIQMLKELTNTLSIEHEQLQKEYQLVANEYYGLKEAHQDTQLQLNQLSEANNGIYQLLKGEQGEEGKVDDHQLQEKIKAMIAAAALHQVLIKEKQEEIDTLKQETQQLKLKSENNAKLIVEKDAFHTDEKEKLESSSKDLAEERNQLMAHITILQTNTTDDVSKIAQENSQLKEKYEKENADLMEIKNTLESTEQENIDLHTRVKEAQDQLKEHTLAFEQSTKTEVENKKLKQAIVDMELASKEAAQQVMNENEQLEQHNQEMQETTHTLVASRKSIVTENEELKNRLKTLDILRQENQKLTELVGSLQNKMNELQSGGERPTSLKKTLSSFKRKQQDEQQEELMRMHTKAQLGLIEYLEGEDDVIQAMARFKRQLEDRM